MADERSRTSGPGWRGKAEPTPSAKPKKSDYKWTERGLKPVGAVERPDSRSFRLIGVLVG
jgi:hypothetical protein